MTEWRLEYPDLEKMERYNIIKMIGHGGMADVFLSHDTVLDEKVAIKVLKPALSHSRESIERFKREIRIARKITHRNICRIYEFDTVKDLFLIVMEYIEGNPLSDFLRGDKKFPDDQKLPMIINILRGLEEAHRANVMHRDLKPSNILITSKFVPIIMDFGLARYVGQSELTPTQSVFGTPGYMSPEQISGESVDQRSDIYNLGIIVYELLTGKYPFNETNAYKLFQCHVYDDPIAPRKVNPLLSNKIEGIILKCLEKSPDDRYQTVDELLNDLFAIYSSDPVSIASSYKKKKKRVLIVDDDALIRNVISKMFETMGFDIILSTNGREAIDTAHDEQPDLICMDVMMPRMTGIEAAEILLANPQTQNIPIVILSCKDDQDYIVYSRQLGIKDYLLKPVQYADIENRVRYWLELDTSSGLQV